MAVKYWSAEAALYEFDYDTGTHAPVVGEVINVDVEAAETAIIVAWTVATGTWGGNNAAGKMWVYTASATFITNLQNNDNIDDSADNQICITTGGVTLKTGDWDIAGNWGTGEDPTIPVANDEVVFDGRSTISVDDGIAVGETGGVDFDLLHVKESFTGDIGASGERLHTSAAKIIIEGSGTYYIEVSESVASADQVIPLVIINNKGATVYLTSNRNDGSYCCEFTQVIVTGGTVHIGDSNIDTAVQYLRLSPRYNRRNMVTVTIYEDCIRSKATAYNMSVYMEDGICTMDSAALLIEMIDGIFTYGTDLGANPETGMNITTLRIHSGTFNWHPDDSDGNAYIGDLWLFGGLFDASASTNADRAKVLGNGAGNDVFVFRGSVLNIASGRGNITIAGSSQLWNFGGIITTDAGSQIAISYDQP